MFDDSFSFDLSSPFDGFMFDMTAGNWWSEGNVYSPWDNYSFSPVVGEPTTYFEQTTPFTCAVVSQQMILHDFGINVSEAQLVYDATSNGWLTDNGTSIDDMGKLLEHHGIPTHINYNGDLASIIDELAHGRKIIVPVNSDELWDGVSWWQRLTGWHNTGADHAIVIAGIDFSDQANPMVIVNDPGLPGGGHLAYPLEHFLESWNDSNFTYLATDTAPGGLAQHSTLGSQFNDSTGIYNSSEFWIDIATKIAGIALGTIVTNYFGDGGAAHYTSDFSSPWEDMTDAAREQLFLMI
jgi:hypothetical protein